MLEAGDGSRGGRREGRSSYRRRKEEAGDAEEVGDASRGWREKEAKRPSLNSRPTNGAAEGGKAAMRCGLLVGCR